VDSTGRALESTLLPLRDGTIRISIELIAIKSGGATIL
jgi:hypothetical protein